MANSNGISRRDVIRTGGVLGGLMALPGVARAAVQSSASAAGAPGASARLRPGSLEWF